MRDPRFAEHLAVFVEVVRSGSFSAASRRRAVTPSAIVRQVDALEQDIGTPLLIRSTRALTLTDAGRQLFERGQRLLDELSDAHAEAAAFSNAVVGTLRIACFPTFGKRYVIPVIDALMTAHEGLKVELDLTERLADPVLERLDIVIRMGVLQDTTLIATKLAPLSRTLAASPEYLGKHGVPTNVEDLVGHRLLDKLHGPDLLGWRDILGSPAGVGHFVSFRSDDFEALNSAALAGMGICLLPTWVAGPSVLVGALKAISLGGEVWNENPPGIHLLRALPQPSAKVRVFTDALKAHIGTPPVWNLG